VKIKNRIMGYIKKIFMHDCENCGMCGQSSAKVKIIEKNYNEKDE
jgi:hypothetical protein